MSPKIRWIHFCIAAGIVAVMTIGWQAATAYLGWYTRKEPIAWPENVIVSEADFRNLSLPKQFGPYKMVEGDGVIFKEKDGMPDGEIEHREDVLETLHIGSSLDEARVKDRKSNWYVARVYEDTREPANSPYRFWSLDLTFFTGSETTVPHVPDICILAGGSTPIGGPKVLDVDVPGLPKSWDPVPFKAIHYARNGGMGERYVQYYLFSVNGQPVVDRNVARLRLTGLTTRYVYYAKLQFYPWSIVRNGDQADAKAAEFLKYSLPVVLKELPTEADIEKLYEKD